MPMRSVIGSVREANRDDRSPLATKGETHAIVSDEASSALEGYGQ
jgi:hypothetical protein